MSDIPDHLRAIDEMLEAGDYDAARSELDEAGSSPPVEVLRIKLSLYDESVPPPLAMQKLIQLMRQHPDVAGGKALYQEASSRAYQHRQSSVSHSHPPPPVRPTDPKDEE
ncbi:MAG: hypothetical protein HS104_40785 [Polyangiaceae bacterium]|nr:hypothetical protein [Polyangiaceae bacterium]MBK8999947.1 hypothetical protein [Myxococcales bacterium]MCE7894892.1 hypothetical protein [Sorangiineae bacterium PRO1]MCL4753882.1 hypothetical protein [Myxococcales bacterium]